MDGICLRRNWGREYENISILVAVAVNEDGFREVSGAAEGMKEDKTSRVSFFQRLRGRSANNVIERLNAAAPAWWARFPMGMLP